MNSNNLTINIQMCLTEAANAVWRQPPFQVSPAHQPLLSTAQVGDTVLLPPCSSTFVLIGRTWEVQPHALGLMVLLDLAPSEPQLKPA